MLPTSSNSVESPFLSGLLMSSTIGLDISCPENGYSLDDMKNNLSDSPEVVANTSNLLKAQHHRDSKVWRGFTHEFEVV